MAELEKDKTKFFRETLKDSLAIELLMENHLAKLLALSRYVGEPEELQKRLADVTWCKECVENHCLELGRGYSSECLTGACPAQPEWKELASICDELYDFLYPLEKVEQYTKKVFDKVSEFDSRLRDVRKKLEEAGKTVLGGLRYQDDGKEHLT